MNSSLTNPKYKTSSCLPLPEQGLLPLYPKVLGRQKQGSQLLSSLYTTKRQGSLLPNGLSLYRNTGGKCGLYCMQEAHQV